MNETLRIPLPVSTGPLSPEDVAHYSRTGWLAARRLFTAEEAAIIGRWTDELVAAPEVPGRHWVYREKSLLRDGERVIQRIENFCPFHDGFDKLVRGGRLEQAAAQLMGGPVVLFKEKINFKMPGGAGFEPHQDQQAGWSAYAPLFITALVCIDRATVENGCLRMANTPRFAGLIGEEWKPLTPEQMAGFDLTDVPTEPGDVLFFDSYVPHASAPNLTAEARRILYITYNLASDGDHRAQYYADKHANFPPDVERLPDKEYKFRV
jgi:hypothetical protein